MNWTYVFACQRFPTWILKGFVCMLLHNLSKTIVGFLDFTRNALMYVFIYKKNNFSNALNDIDVVYKSFLLSSLKICLLISHKWTLFEGVNDSIKNGSRFFYFFHRRPWKIKSTNGMVFFSYKSFCDDVFELHEDSVLVYYYHIVRNIIRF
jgi:hypothetical protein